MDKEEFIIGEGTGNEDHLEEEGENLMASFDVIDVRHIHF